MFVQFIVLIRYIFAKNGGFVVQIDKLQTNHKGLFVLADSRFKWIEKYSFDDSNVREKVKYVLNFVCGLLRGKKVYI